MSKETTELTQYRVVRVDAEGNTTTLHQTTNRFEAESRHTAAKEAFSRPGVSIRLLTKPDPGWIVVKE